MGAISRTPVKIYMETPDGVVCEITGQVASFEVSTSIPSIPVWEMGEVDPVYLHGKPETETTLRIMGDARWTTGMAINARRSEKEWKCDYCDSPNPRHATHCRKCGAARSFVYG